MSIVISKKTSFVVSELFGHRIIGQVPQWMSDDFQRIVYNPSKEMVIEIPETLPKLKYYTLLEQMNDTTIQKNSGFKSMSLEEYWLLRHLLIIFGQASKETYHIFHVQVGDNVLVFNLGWQKNEWCSVACDFDLGDGWHRGVTLVSLL
jgi:hypothetical protein